MKRQSVIVISLILAVPLVVLAVTNLDTLFEQLETQLNLPRGILAKTCRVESGCTNNPPNSGAGARGMFQFIPSTFTLMSQRHLGRNPCLGRSECGGVDERLDPVISARFTAIMYADNKARLGGLIQQAGMDMIPGLYLTHFLGPAGAQRFIQLYMRDRNEKAAPYFGGGAQRTASGSNRGVFYRSRHNQCAQNECTFAEIYNFTARRLGEAPITTGVSGDFSDPTGVSRGISGYHPPNYFTARTPPPFPPEVPRTFMPAVVPLESGNQLNTQNTTQGTSTGSQVNTMLQAASQLLIQPRSPARGVKVLISWTSAGAQECSVGYDQQSAFGNGKAGTKPWVATLGTYSFRLVCKLSDGTTIEDRQDITVP